ncbi:MAG: hypothetical protein R2764_02255 [Bacteroidales bacterium]
MNTFNYHDVNWNVFSLVNTSEIAKALNVQEIHRHGINAFISDVLSVMTYSTIKGVIQFNVHEIPSGYSMTLDYQATKLRSETLLQYFRIIKAGQKPETGITPWKINLAENLESLVNKSKELKILRREPVDKAFPVSLYAQIDFDKLIITDEPIDKPDPHASVNSRPFIVPPELLDEIINENLWEAISLFGKDNERLIHLLEPLSGKVFYADFLIASAYYVCLRKPRTAYLHLQRALNLMYDDVQVEVAASVFDMMADIEIDVNNDFDAAELSFLCGLVAENTTSFLNLAYLYLQQANHQKKDYALYLARMGEQLLPDDPDPEHQVSGYHIVASVYLWHNLHFAAQLAHDKFLSDLNWCLKYPEFVSAYLMFAIANENADFIIRMLKDYEPVWEHFPLIIETYAYAIFNPQSPQFRMEMVPVINQINDIKRTYRF